MPDDDPRAEVLDDDTHVAAEIPGASGHHEPGERAAAVDHVLDAEPVQQADRVTVVVPRGDHEAYERITERLEPDEVRAAGASVIVESTGPPRPAEECDT
jgi:class 3 adenylate cyclase